MAEKKKLSKKTLAKSFRNWSYGNLTCFSQEHMQTFGYLCAMLPIVEELYDTPEEQKQALQTYSAFFNTEPQIGTMIVGVTARPRGGSRKRRGHRRRRHQRASAPASWARSPALATR